MRKNRSQFIALLAFLLGMLVVLTNGFVGRILAEPNQVDVFTSIQPIGYVLNKVLEEYVEEPDLNGIVEGALVGMMNSLDDHSSYIPSEAYTRMLEETQGEFSGIGIYIDLDEGKNVFVRAPIPGQPAELAGLRAGDIFVKVDETATKGMSLDQVQRLIKGPRGESVHIVVLRRYPEDEDKRPELLEFDIVRDRIPLPSIGEARLLEDGIAYVRVDDFKKTTADDLAAELKELETQGMRSLILDLRGNPGGLLTASQEMCELFLPKNTLVTYTQGRMKADGTVNENNRLYTNRNPIVPATFPIVLLVNRHTASSSEIVTGALQFHKRAIVIGEKTYGKGSVQTIIELNLPQSDPEAEPKKSALRLTTALYYTPAEVTINKEGIRPDIEVPMGDEEWMNLVIQLRDSMEDDPNNRSNLNHGSVTGNEATEDTVEDTQLLRAVELLHEDPMFENIINKYHKDPSITQVAAADSLHGDSESAQEDSAPEVAE